jgi:hypothetical protein
MRFPPQTDPLSLKIMLHLLLQFTQRAIAYSPMTDLPLLTLNSVKHLVHVTTMSAQRARTWKMEWHHLVLLATLVIESC